VADAQKEIELYRKLQASQAPQAGTTTAPEKTDP
jgi:hypothetical protein